jgi:hypothetical protein
VLVANAKAFEDGRVECVCFDVSVLYPFSLALPQKVGFRKGSLERIASGVVKPLS